MRIAIVSSFVPFARGGDRSIAEWLVERLQDRGHQVELIYLPFVETRPAEMFSQIDAYRSIDLSGSADLLIAIRPPAYVLPHPRKILWFIHHIRNYYDAWVDLPSTHENRDFFIGCRRRLMEIDNRTLREARHVFTISRTVTKRLRDFNQLESEVLYPPLHRPQQYHCQEYNDEIVCICRMEAGKRPHLMIEAMRYVKTDVKIRLCGSGLDQDYATAMKVAIKHYEVDDQVIFDNRWVSEEEKISIIGRSLACAYVPRNEDFGYFLHEAAHSQKALLTTSDSGALLEFIDHGLNGLVCDPEPQAIAEALDALYRDRERTKLMGRENKERMKVMKIDWDHVIERLLS